MSVEFPPAEDSPRSNEIVNRVLEIVRSHEDAKTYEKVEVNLIQFVPQELAKTRKFTWNMTESKFENLAPSAP